MLNNIPDMILQETKHLSDDLLKEVLDFVLFLKTKNQEKSKGYLSNLQKSELAHLEDEFENYKTKYPNE